MSDQKRRWCRFCVVFRKPTRSVRQKLASADQQPSTNEKTNTSSISDKTKKRKTLFNSRENSLVVSGTKDQVREGPKHVQSNSTAMVTSQGNMHANQGRGAALNQSETAYFSITAGSGTQPVLQMKIGQFFL